MRFRKKPVEIEAQQFDGSDEAAQRLGLTEVRTSRWKEPDGDMGRFWAVATLEGTMRAEPGDWIITGVKGELYPCKPDIFALTYEPAE